MIKTIEQVKDICLKNANLCEMGGERPLIPFYILKCKDLPEEDTSYFQMRWEDRTTIEEDRGTIFIIENDPNFYAASSFKDEALFDFSECGIENGYEQFSDMLRSGSYSFIEEKEYLFIEAATTVISSFEYMRDEPISLDRFRKSEREYKESPIDIIKSGIITEDYYTTLDVSYVPKRLDSTEENFYIRKRVKELLVQLAYHVSSMIILDLLNHEIVFSILNDVQDRTEKRIKEDKKSSKGQIGYSSSEIIYAKSTPNDRPILVSEIAKFIVENIEKIEDLYEMAKEEKEKILKRYSENDK